MGSKEGCFIEQGKVVMDPDFWHQKWENNEIAFHEGETNPALLKYFDQLGLKKGARVFVPLCGKTRDIAWLLSSGYRVVGVELSRIAIDQLFAEMNAVPKISADGSVLHYSANDLDIYVGDLFSVSKSMLGSVDAVYDRAALVALPQDMRRRYVAHVDEMAGQVPRLLLTYEYDQNVLSGPPFSVSREEVQRHYSGRYDLTLLACLDIPAGLRGKCPARESVWLIKFAC